MGKTMTTHTEDLVEIQDLNLTYLLIAQRLLKSDFTTALMRLKIDDDLGRHLLSLSARQVGRLARNNQMLFRPCLDGAAQLAQLTHNVRDQGMDLLHGSLLMASAPLSGMPAAAEGV